MFKRILIANRGEIACRIIRTARRMGIATVAVYSQADRNALHVEMADSAEAIGPSAAAESYLSIAQIVDACRRSGADAVHPGYGFLSERAAFASALAEAGIAFIGPHARAIAVMGDKIESKKAAAAAGVSTVPGALGVIADAAQAREIAGEIGYPVMLKAAGGGGGKGMRIAHNAAEVEDGFTRARSEAQSAFGDDRIFIEKFITDPRHIEIQVLGDKHGNVIHLGERECSIQRRNQKVVEEAPSPLLDAATRARMGEQAVALARAVRYDSAGTVEFVAAQDRSFYFLEMNTRLQVEHPVTELVTGIDLVEEMIRAAAGERLRMTQDDVTFAGWAVETRVYAEDPYRSFLPSVGRLTTYEPPQERLGEQSSGVTVRVDDGVREGSEISIFYDPMIAKLVTHAPTRREAIAAQAHALDRFAIDGIRHNIPFLSALMNHPRWQDGRLSTAFIAEEYPDGFHPRMPEGQDARRMVAVSAALDYRLRERAYRIAGQIGTPADASCETRLVRLGQREFRVSVAGDQRDAAVGGPYARVTFDEDDGSTSTSRVDLGWSPGHPVWHGLIDGEPHVMQVRIVDSGFALSHAGYDVVARIYSEAAAAVLRLMPEKIRGAADKALRCPMPGVVMSIDVSEGQEVRAGERLAVVEAMKMENVLRAEHDGTVKAIFAKRGDVLSVDAPILEFA